jgi:DNA-binding response OmpR family regulator
MNRVLVVDDESSISKLIETEIKEIGFDAITAESATQALSIFHSDSPGIVITDLNLGGEMDGVSLCSRIRYEDKSVVVIAMSGFFSEYDKIYCLEAGFSDFLAKPIGRDDLFSAVQCAFDRRSRWKGII